MLVGKLTYPDIKQRQKEKLSPNHVPSEFMSLKNNPNIERPLKSNSQNSTFKGLSFNGENQQSKKDDKMKPLLATLGVLFATGLALRLAPAYKQVGKYSEKEFLNFIKQKSQLEPEIIIKHLEHLKKSEHAKKLIEIKGDQITLYKKTVPQLIWDGLMYPFKVLPGDILNGTVKGLGKIKPLKNWSDKTLEKNLLKKIRQRSKVDAQVNSLRGMFQKFDELNNEPDNKVIASKMFQQSVKMFDPKTGNYDTKHERSLNRIVSGLPPAIFLANDAYNLSRMMDDDDKAAKHEQKTRFKQEAARVGFNAYITLITLGALQKYINNSALGIFISTGLTTLTTEAFSRLINGKHITRLTPEKARAENAKNNAPEAQIKPDTSFKASENKDEKEKQQKPLLSFDTVMKASAFIIAGGFGVKGLRKIPAVEKQWKAFSGFFKKHYKKLTEIPDYTIEKSKLDEITKILEDNGFKQLAAKYKEIGNRIKFTEKNVEYLKLGEKDKKIKPLVNFVIAPFKFAWNTVTLPYNLVMKVVKPIEVKFFNKGTKKVVENTSEKLAQADIDALAKSIENIGKKALEFNKKNKDPKQFEDYVRDNIMKSFNADTMSNVSNSELSNLAKTAASVATIWFLMTDNYNMVMLKSNGNDVEGAKTKFTERFVQEGSRLFYQTLLIDLFNSTFSKQYNRSLFGMSWVTLTDTTIGEWLTRKSVGVPVGTHSRDGLIKLEEKQENATGFKKSCYNFMKRLTGKRSIKSYEIDNNKSQPVEQINFTNNSLLTKMVKN